MNNTETAYTVKQPELGQKIVTLRKTRRLTQEELVEKCNISIRTIQRIESGEVMPRDYTVKTILAALDFDLDQIADEEEAQAHQSILRNTHRSADYLATHLKIAFVFGIVYFVLRFLEGAADTTRFVVGTVPSVGVYAAIKIGLLGSVIFFQRGFIIIGTLLENRFLKLAATILIGVYVLVIGFDLFALLSGLVDSEVVLVVYAIGLGAAGVIYGLSLYQWHGPIAGTAKIAGIIEIVAGCLSLTVVLSAASVFVLIPAELLEIVILYKVIELIRKEDGQTAST